MSREESWQAKIREILAQRDRREVTGKGLSPAAVLVPIYENNGDFFIVLTQRTQSVVHHKGQMAFPGGAYDDEDGDRETTALREAFEETGIRAEDVNILGELDDQATATSRFSVTPFVGAIPYPYNFVMNREEVDDIVEASVRKLIDPACFSNQTPDADGNLQPWVHYQYGEYKITGITAMILEQFLSLVFSSGGL